MNSTAKMMTDVETVSMYFNCVNLSRRHGLEMKVNFENIRFEIFKGDQVVFYAGKLGDVFIFLSGVSLGKTVEKNEEKGQILSGKKG